MLPFSYSPHHVPSRPGPPGRIQNFGYLIVSLKGVDAHLSSPAVERACSLFEAEYDEAISRYVIWMVGYEFRSAYELAVKLEALIERVGAEEVVLYVDR